MWDWAIRGALIASGIAASGALALLATRALAAWRTFNGARQHTVDKLDALATKAELTAQLAETAGDNAELQESVARLRVSLAQLAVLRSAIAEVEDAAGWVTALL